MDWQSKQAQWGVYLALLLITGLATSAGYHHLRQEMVLFHRAEAALEANDSASAVSLYRRALAQGLKDPRARLRLAEAYQAQGDLLDGVRVLEEGLAVQPHDEQLIVTLSRFYLETGQLDKGIALASQLPDDPATRFAFWRQLGDLAVARQEFTRAVVCYRNALAIEPVEAAVIISLAATLGWLHQYDEAVALYGQVLDRQPDNRTARLGLARVLGWSGRLEEAITQYRRLLEEKR